jgi:protein required for attachment to host cells
MAQIWIVVADGSRARFFERCKDRTLEEFDTLVSPTHRLKETSLSSDRAGRTFDSRGAGRHALEPPHSAKDHGTLVFARQVAERIDDARIAGDLDKLVLIAPPEFLGKLRSSLDKQSLALVAKSIDKELTQASAEEVAGHLPQFL